MKTLPSNFELDRYGLYMRLLCEEVETKYNAK